MFPEPFIDFDYILEDRFAPEFEQKQAKLQELAAPEDEMKDMDTTLDAIKAILDKVFKK